VSAALQVAQSISRDNPIRYDHIMSTNAKNPTGNELHNTAVWSVTSPTAAAIRRHDHDGLHKKTKLKCKQNFLKYLRELETFQTDCHRTNTIAACTVTGQLFIAYKKLCILLCQHLNTTSILPDVMHAGF